MGRVCVCVWGGGTSGHYRQISMAWRKSKRDVMANRFSFSFESTDHVSSMEGDAIIKNSAI